MARPKSPETTRNRRKLKKNKRASRSPTKTGFSISPILKKPYGFVPPTCRIHINAITGKSKISPRCNASWAAPEPSSVVCGESWGSFSESWGCSSEENLRKGVPGSPQEAPRRSKTLLRRPKTRQDAPPRRSRDAPSRPENAQSRPQDALRVGKMETKRHQHQSKK